MAFSRVFLSEKSGITVAVISIFYLNKQTGILFSQNISMAEKKLEGGFPECILRESEP